MRIHARRAVGPAPAGARAVVLVHGLGVSGRYMVPTLLALRGAHPVWAPDLPGFGDSAKPDHALTIGELADALGGWMDTVGLERPVLVGNSLGCQVIGHLVRRGPARLSGAVFVSPTMDPGARGPLRQILRLVLDAPREDPRLIPIALRDYVTAGPRRAWRTLRDALRDPVREHLPEVRAPTLVVRGARDPIVSQGWAEEVARLLPRGRLVVIPHAAHAVNFSAPDALVRAIRPFLEDLPWP